MEGRPLPPLTHEVDVLLDEDKMIKKKRRLRRIVMLDVENAMNEKPRRPLPSLPPLIHDGGHH